MKPPISVIVVLSARVNRGPTIWELDTPSPPDPKTENVVPGVAVPSVSRIVVPVALAEGATTIPAPGPRVTASVAIIAVEAYLLISLTSLAISNEPRLPRRVHIHSASERTKLDF
jgi:hypothetical protein